MDLYAVLNLAPGALPLRLLAAHPDKNNTSQPTPDIAAIKDTYRVLSSPALRPKAKAHQDPRWRRSSRSWTLPSRAPMRGCMRVSAAVQPARTRKFDNSDAPLPEDGLGNKEFNTFHADWDKYDFAYRILAVREIPLGISLQVMKDRYGMKAAPRGLVYVPSTMTQDFPLREQKFLWAVEEALEIRDSVGEDSN
ncbi:hypothetical protein B0H14DRAFT_3493639 [Mycena olivaceomarginata]|nr:hypothetical protein B0H14DRAFT_3493639 [Mycena olivaceomarginata]